MNALACQILDLSYRHQLSHISSNLSALPVLVEMFGSKRPEDLVVLSSGHAGLALYVCLEKYQGEDAEALLLKHGSQPGLDVAAGIHCSSGSLGMGLTMAVGYALADSTRQVLCLVSDGECAEGCVWEALGFISEHGLTNISLYVNANGYRALGEVNTASLANRLIAFLPVKQLHFRLTKFATAEYPPLQGLAGHYHILKEKP
jgi:transketolase